MEWAKCANCEKNWPVEVMEIGEVRENHRIANPNQPLITVCPKCIKDQDDICDELGIDKTSERINSHANDKAIRR